MLQSTLGQNDTVKELGSVDAWRRLQEDESSVLIDVRTIPEWSFIGVPDLSSLKKEVKCISWRVYPTMEINTQFSEQVESELGQNYERPLLFICRTGGRSYDAALVMLKCGYQHCYNVTDGFEGDLDANGHRGMVNGWKKEKLAWIQG